MMRRHRSFVIFTLIALTAAFALTRGLVGAPNYTDAYYHFNAAVRIASGQGLTEPYLWTYIGAPDALPASGVTPSHLYWMPMTSLIAAGGMRLLNAVGNYGAAQLPFSLMFAAAACVGYVLGKRIGGGERHAWIAGLLVLFSGFYVRYWGTMDTFAPYALFGSLCLLVMGQAAISLPSYRYWALSGAFAGLAHLTRADGILLLLVGYIVISWGVWKQPLLRQRIQSILVLTCVYLLVMLPWFVRNLEAVGTPLPLGGTQAIWFTQYDDLFGYPSAATPEPLFALGLGAVLQTRWEAFAGPSGLFSGNLGTFIAVEGMVVITPLMLSGLWKRRQMAFLRGFWLYVLGLHVAMTLVFPYPGYRGGLLHSAAALVPWWAALGVAGLDDVVDWIARRRRQWNPTIAKWVFSSALLAMGVFLSLSIGLRGQVAASDDIPPFYAELLSLFPQDARVMINDPARLYYHTGLGGVVTPNADPSVIEEIARRYDIDYVVLEAAGIPGRLVSVYDNPPPFLMPLDFTDPNVRVYAIRR